MSIEWEKGSGTIDVIIAAAIIVLVILPIFSVIAERYIILNKAEIIKDAVDMTNVSVYNAINAGVLGKTQVDIELDKADDIYRRLLSENLNLNVDLSPRQNSLAEDDVKIKSIVFYSGEAIEECPEGIVMDRPSIHSVIVVPIRPSLYRQLILNLLGKQYVELEIHVDSEIPINN